VGARFHRVITARFLAREKKSARRLVPSRGHQLILFEKQGLLETYEPKGATSLDPRFRDSTPPYT